MTYDDLLNEMCNGKRHMFIQAAAGYGKSTLIKRMQEQQNKSGSVLYCASTGLAAYNIKGKTLHSTFGIGPYLQTKENLDLPFSRKQLIRAADTLLIDEVSMVRIDVLDKINSILQNFYKTDDPFGGIRIILIGDLFQLGVIVQQKERSCLKELYPFANNDYSFYNAPVFEEKEFQNNLDIYELQHNFRQSEDIKFRELLSLVRFGVIDDYLLNEINTREVEPPQKHQFLTLSHSSADNYNNHKLHFLNDKNPAVSIASFNLIKKQPDPIYWGQIPRKITIKDGMQIMFVKNDSARNGRRWVNGDIGIVTRKMIGEGNKVKSVFVEANGKIYEVFREKYEFFEPTYDNEKQKIRHCVEII
jgi:ATP-dependent exoDNAse (exonuclease V) alpha subunit